MLPTGVSLLERMMKDFPLYQKNDGVLNNQYVTKLLHNYRCGSTDAFRTVIGPNDVFDLSCLLIGPHLCFKVSPRHPEDPQRALLWRRAAGLCGWNFTQLLLQLAVPPEEGNGSSLNTSDFDIMSEVSPLRSPLRPSASTSAPQTDSLRPGNEDTWL